MKKTFTVSLFLFLCNFTFSQVIWDMQTLKNPPVYRVTKTDSILTIFFEGIPYKGRRTEVFAYYTTPGLIYNDKSKDKNLPAAVLLHGGGGTAFREWVTIWAKRGYAAIAISWDGKGPDGKHLSYGGPTLEGDKMALSDSVSIYDNWEYQVIAKAILSHSLIRSFPEVDSSRTILTGISVGGILTCVLAGVDHRFKAAIPVYGCGYLYRNGKAWDYYLNMNRDLKEQWIKKFDPSSYLSQVTTPMLFINGTNDHYFPVDIWASSSKIVKNANRNLIVEMLHSHEHGWAPQEIYAFADHFTKNGTPLPQIMKVNKSRQEISARVKSDTRLVKASLNYTTNDSDTTSWENKKWVTEPAIIENNTLRVKLSQGKMTAYYLSVTDERGLTVSSEVLFRVKKR